MLFLVCNYFIINYMEGIIYMYTSPNGKKYIGQTVDEVNRRSKFMNLNQRYAGSKIDNARKKYGPENFEYKVLMKVDSDNQDELKSTLNTLEIGLIKMFDTVNNGYNSSEGGDCGTTTDEIKKKISKSLKGHSVWNKGVKTGQIPWNKGKYMSDEIKMKLSISHLGQTAWNKGKSISEEQKQKLIDSWKGKHHNTDSIKKISEGLKGVSKSEEHRKHISESKKGRHRVYNTDGTYHYE